jgi:hypothetical protein
LNDLSNVIEDFPKVCLAKIAGLRVYSFHLFGSLLANFNHSGGDAQNQGELY